MPESESLFSRIIEGVLSRVRRTHPLRMVLYVLSVYYLIKNMVTYEGSFEKPILTPEQERKVAEQSVKNWDRTLDMLKIIGFLGLLLVIMKYINYKQEKEDQELEERRREIEEFEEANKDKIEAYRKGELDKEACQAESKKKKK